VIAPGGSIIYRPALMDYLKQRAVLVFLDEPFEIIRERLKNAATRASNRLSRTYLMLRMIRSLDRDIYSHSILLTP
jgi:shikimate kinase